MADPILEDYQFSLDGYVFGHAQPIFLDADEGFDPGAAEEEVQDGQNPQNGARVFGRDVLKPPTWTWTLHVDRTDEETALAELAAMGSAWRNPAYRANGAVAMLRYRLGGRTRCVFGRPRRYSYKFDNRFMQGYVPPMATFDLADDKHYDENEDALDLQLVPMVPGGFEVPFVAPISIDRDENAPTPGAVVVGGDTSTAPVVEFVGPVTNPRLTIGPFTVGLDGTLPSGSTVIIDPRPWAMRVTRTGPAAAVALTAQTRLAKALVPPGAYQAVFTGVDYSGQARCRVRWRNAYTTL